MRNEIKITATPNFKNRTFTIRKYKDGKIFSKYRTFRMDKDEFNSCLYNTENDWKQHLKSDEYSVIK